MFRVTVWRTVPFVGFLDLPVRLEPSTTPADVRASPRAPGVSALSRSVALGVGVRSTFSLRSIDDPVFLKSKRVADLSLRLVDRVADFLRVELGDHVERRHLLHSLSRCARRRVRRTGQ